MALLRISSSDSWQIILAGTNKFNFVFQQFGSHTFSWTQYNIPLDHSSVCGTQRKEERRGEERERGEKRRDEEKSENIMYLFSFSALSFCRDITRSYGYGHDIEGISNGVLVM